MSLDRDLLRTVRRLDEHDLRRLLMFAGGLLTARTGDLHPLAPSPGEGTGGAGRVSLRQQWVRCGKEGCTRCPHGPYWYAHWRENGRVRSRYLGKHLPAAGREAGRREAGRREAGRREGDDPTVEPIRGR